MWVIYAGRHLSRILKQISMPWPTIEPGSRDPSVQRRALYHVAINFTGGEKTWPDRDSNPGRLAYRASTLPTELPSHLVDL